MDLGSLNRAYYSVSAKSKKNYFTIIFAIVWLCVYGVMTKGMYLDLFHYNFKPSLSDLAFFVASLYMIYQLFWAFTGEVTYTISDHKLFVKVGIIGLKSTRIYNIEQIKGIDIDRVTSNSYWGFPGVRLYDSESDVLTFDYKGNKKTLGLNLDGLDLEQLKKAISGIN